MSIVTAALLIVLLILAVSAGAGRVQLIQTWGTASMTPREGVVS